MNPPKSRKITDIIALKPPPPLPRVESRNYSKALRSNTNYLTALLPPSSLEHWDKPRKYGNHLGIPCVCGTCGDRPPDYIKPWNRWRWMNFHQIRAHKGMASVKRIGKA